MQVGLDVFLQMCYMAVQEYGIYVYTVLGAGLNPAVVQLLL